MRRVRDFAQVKGTGRIDSEITKIALKALNIDQYGLDEIDNRILLTIIDKFRGGPVGITTIATAVGEDAGTVRLVDVWQQNWPISTSDVIRIVETSWNQASLSEE